MMRPDLKPRATSTEPDLFQYVFDLIPALAYILDADGSNEVFNKPWHEYTGFTAGQARNGGWAKTFHPDDIGPILIEWEDIRTRQRPGEVTGRLRRFDGVYRTFIIRARPVCDHNGMLIKWYGAFTDIEDRIQGEKALERALAEVRESEDRLRTTIDTIPGLVWGADLNGAAVYLNQQWLSYTGMTMQTALGFGWTSIIHPQDLDGLIEQWMRIIASKNTGEVEARMRRHDGEYRWFLFRGAPTIDAAGNVLCWYGTNTDIDDLKRAETLLAGEKELFEMIAIGRALPETLKKLCHVVEEILPGSIAAIFLMDGDGKRLRHAAAPSLPIEYIRAIEDSPAARRACSPGTAAFTKAKIHSPDIASDPLWSDGAEAALRHGLRACFATPVLSSGSTVLGAFAFYSRTARPATVRENLIADQFTNLAGMLIERRRAEDAVAKSEALLAEGQRISQTGSWIWNVESGIIRVTEEFRRIFGFPIEKADITRDAFTSTVFPADAARVQTILDDAVRRRCEFSIEYRITLSDGSIKHIHSRARPELHPAGVILQFIGTAMDISYRYEAKLALENALARAMASEDQLRLFIDRLPGLAWTSGPNGEAEFLSQGWLDYTGMTHQEAEGMGWANAIHPDDLVTMVENWQKIIATKKMGDQEARLRRHDGVYRWFSFRGAPLLDQWGHIQKWYGVNIDVEDRKLAEMELQRQEAALRKAEADMARVTRLTTMGELTASIAHEVSQPLTGIVLGGNAALRWLRAESPDLEEARDLIRGIIQDGKRAGQVIDRIRKLFKKEDLVKEPLDIGDVIEEVLVLLRNKLQQNRIVKTLDLAADLPKVPGDRVQIQQVLMNLILNAIDAMSLAHITRRELTITTRATAEGQLSVEVRDTGTGIEAKDQERIFETFHTTKPGGMGMGLAICRSIVVSHGGQIRIVPQEGPGAVVRFTLATC